MTTDVDAKRLREVALQALSTFKNGLFPVQQFQLTLLESPIYGKFKEQIDQFFSKNVYVQDSNGSFHLDEFRSKLDQLGIEDDSISELIGHLDRNKGGNLTEAETSRFLDRTRFLSLTRTGGCEIKDTAHRAIEVAQLEKLYEYVEAVLGRSESWDVTRMTDSGRVTRPKRLIDPKEVNLYDMSGKCEETVE